MAQPVQAANKRHGAYLAVSVNNIAIDMLRKRQKSKLFADAYTRSATEADSVTAEQSIDAQLLEKEIENVIHRLPAKTQTIFRLTRYEHKSVKKWLRSFSSQKKQ
ncbi:hypothetical protein LWM68_09155 [Niabella sp. W65]|nr:hypothetical protein [Niabella sp. W65]MCH7362920.1 hypothetical protein [Niabella sp. W65]